MDTYKNFIENTTKISKEKPILGLLIELIENIDEILSAEKKFKQIAEE